MKNINKTNQLLLGLAMLLATNNYAQVFEITPATSGEFGRTETPFKGVGIGNFPSSQITDAALHVNTNYMSTSSNYPGIDFGEVFRTDAPNVATYWRMLRGGTNYGTLFNNNDNHFYIQATNASGELRFQSGGANTRMIVSSIGDVGIGTITPGNLLHLNNPAAVNVLTQYSNANAPNGMLVGAAANGDGWVNNTTNSNLSFFTFNMPRMTIQNGGQIAIGDNFSGAQGLLHQEVIGSANNWHYFTNGQTGNTAADGLRLGLFWNGTNTVAQLRYSENQQMQFLTNDLLRMNMTTLNVNAAARTRVGINRVGGTLIVPRSILHLGDNYLANIDQIGGWRTWMETGTFCDRGTDFAFFGIMEQVGDTVNITGHNDAAIVWGDNINPANEGADNLRFIFSAPMNQTTNDWSTQFSALEVARFDPNGRMGIGNFTANAFGGGSGIQPVRRLEIYDESLNLTLNPAPQLRLTFTPNANVILGIHTDFQTTAAGNLFINPRNAGVNQFVGINTATPGNTLEINSNAANATAGTSGLRFTDLNNASTGVGTITRALTVDGNGDVVLGDLPGGGGTVSACASPGLNLTNYITKITGNNEICRTHGIYEDSNSPFATGIGITPSSIPSIANSPSKLQVNGNVLITAKNSYNAYNSGNVERRLLGMYGPAGEFTLAVGPLAGNNNINTSQCVFVGHSAGLNTDRALQCTFIGHEAGTNYIASEEGANTFTGFRSGASITDYSFNSFYGANSGQSLTDGEENAFFGANAGNGFRNGSRNTYIGRLAGTAFNGDENVFLGYFSGVTWGPPSIQNRMALGSNTQSQCDDCAILGNRNQYIGIGEYHPAPSMWNNFNGCRLVVQPIAGSNNAAFFNGNIFATALNPSDSIIKNNISVYANSSAVIDAMDVYSYNFNANACPQLNLPQGNQVGFISQQVENIVPGLVNSFTIPAVYDSSGNTQHPEFTFKALNYAGIVPYLVSALKEFKSRLDSLQQQLNSCCNLRIPAPENSGSIELENIRSMQLFSADPNPFSESTIIRWSLPDDFSHAVIYFYDDKGNRINQYTITEKGNGQLQLFGSRLSSGVYSYTLVVDNRIVETRRMVKMK